MVLVPSDDALFMLSGPAAVAAALRQLRVRAGSPSFTDVTRRVVQVRLGRGLPDSEARVGRVTVYDCFRDDRKRFDSALVVDIAQSLGASPTELMQWRAALRSLEQRAQAATVVSIVDQLPDATAKFVGRERELAAITGDRRPFWISGMPGVGKSQVVYRGARRLLDDGAVTRVLVVDLRGHSPQGPPAEPSAVIEGLLRLCGPTSRQRTVPVDNGILKLSEHLSQAGILLILDDAANSDQVAAVLGEKTPAQVWVTSRSHPDNELASSFQRISLEPFAAKESMELLAAHIGWPKVNSDVQAATHLVESAGHLPLAVDIAATRLAAKPSWSLQDHLDLIHRRHEALRIDQAVERTFSMSYKALPTDAREMLRLIAVHPLSQLDHTSALALAEGVVPDAAAALTVLTARHMLTRPRDGWYAIHELLRVHIADVSLEEDPPSWRTAAQGRLVSNLTARAWGAYRTRTRGTGEVPREPRIPLQIPTMDASQAEAFFRDMADLLLLVAHEPQWHLEGYPVVIALSETLTSWLDHVGRFQDAHELHAAALSTAERLADEEGQVRARVDLGMRLTAVGRYEEAEAHLRTALTQVADRPREGVSAFNALGIVCERRGAVEEAESHYHRAIELAEQIADRRRLGHALSNLAGVFMRTGRLAECDQALTRSTEFARQAGDHISVARGLVNLSSLALARDEPAKAEATAREALAHFERLQQVPGVVICCSNIAAALMDSGQHEQALEWLERGLRLCQEIGMRQHETTLHVRFAHCMLALGQPQPALLSAHTALDIAREIQDPHAEASALTVLGDGLQADASTAEARDHWQAALQLMEELGAPEAEALRDKLATVR